MPAASLSPFRSRNFALLWSAALVSNIGSWVQAVALGIMVTVATHNPTWTGAIAAAAFLPNGLLAPFGGALADRLDRRRWLLVTTLAEAACAAVLSLLAATGHASPAAAVAVAFVGGCATAVGLPAYQAMLPELVERDDLLAAVSLSSAQYNMGRVVGPAIAGVAIVAGSYSLAFAVNAASFGAVVVALLLLRLPAPPPSSRPPARLLAQVTEGMQIAWADPGCRAAIGLIGAVALLASPFIALVPAMVVSGLHVHGQHEAAAGTSVLVTAQGIGAVVGVLALPSLARRLGRGTAVRAALWLLPVLLVLYGLAPSLATAAAALGVLGAGYIGVLSGLNTVVQLRAPAAARGRVLSCFMLALGTAYPLGALGEGAVGRAVGVRVVTVAGALALVVVMAALALTRRSWLAALGHLPAGRAPELSSDPSVNPADVPAAAPALPAAAPALPAAGPALPAAAPAAPAAAPAAPADVPLPNPTAVPVAVPITDSAAVPTRPHRSPPPR